jgi:hypothetical protein
MAIIDKPTDYFNTILYTGTSGTSLAIYRSWVSTRSGFMD